MLMCKRLLIAAAIAVFSKASSANPPVTTKSSIPSAAVTNLVTAGPTSSTSHGPVSSPTTATWTCRLSEYRCGTGHCIAQDKFCDGENDCEDKSDEPKYCTRKSAEKFQVRQLNGKQFEDCGFMFDRILRK